MTTRLAGIDFSQSIQTTFDSIAEYVPRIVAALVIFIIGRFIAKFIFKLVKKVLQKANIDGIMDKAGIGGPLQRAGFADAGVFFAKLIYWLIMFIVIKMTVEALGLDAIQQLVDDLVNWLPKLIVALIIVVITGMVANFVKGIVGGATANETWGNAATSVATIGVWFIGGMAALDQVQIASDIVDTLFTAITSALAAILVIKFGVGGIWSARDNFWPGVYNKFGSSTKDTSAN